MSWIVRAIQGHIRKIPVTGADVFLRCGGGELDPISHDYIYKWDTLYVSFTDEDDLEVLLE